MRKSQLKVSDATAHTYFHLPEKIVFTSINVFLCMWLKQHLSLFSFSFFAPLKAFHLCTFTSRLLFVLEGRLYSCNSQGLRTSQ